MKALGLLLLLLAPAWGAPVPEPLTTAAVDPRIELLGVVQQLAGLGKRRPEAEAVLGSVEKRFGRWKGHEAVRRYAKIAAKGDETLALIAFAWSDPPALGWAQPMKGVSVDFIERAGGEEEVEAFRAALADFARKSDFAGYITRHADDFRGFEARALLDLRGKDFIRLVEDYVGRGLNARYVVTLSILYTPGTFNSYIVPYPVGPKQTPDGPFTVYRVISPSELVLHGPFTSRINAGLWCEPLYIVVSPLTVKLKEQIAGYKAAGKKLDGQCLEDWPSCADHLLVMAIADRLNRRIFGEAIREAQPKQDVVWKLSARLEAYEKDRKRYPTLAEFFPRLVAGLARP